jgi:hypothetical protein
VVALDREPSTGGAAALILPVVALAADIRSGKDITIGPGEIVTDDVYAFGNNILVQGTGRGDVIAAGSSVNITGHVTGSVMAAGSTIVVSGPVDGSVRVAGNVLTVASPVGNDVILAGSLVTINGPGSIGRDVLAAGNSVNVQAPVAGNVKSAANTLTLGSTIGGAVDAQVTDLGLSTGAVIHGPVSYISANDATVSSGARVDQPMLRSSPPPRATNPWDIGGVDTFGWLRGFIGLALFGILLLLAFPRATAAAAATVESHWPASLGLGFALLVGTPILAALVFMLGLIVGGWWIGLLLLGLYAALAIVGYVVFAEWLGLAALRMATYKAHDIWALLVGLLILGLATLILVVGVLAVFAAIVFGMGAVALSGWRAYSGAPQVDWSPIEEQPPTPLQAAA